MSQENQVNQFSWFHQFNPFSQFDQFNPFALLNLAVPCKPTPATIPMGAPSPLESRELESLRS